MASDHEKSLGIDELRTPVAVAMIVARAENGVIGKGGALPWHISEDLKHFKRMTVGKPIVMGRKTFESIGKPLPKRTNIVITRNRNWSAEGVVTAEDLPTALALAFENAHSTGADEVMIIGGAEIYSQALTHAARIYLTEVHADYDGDAVLALDLSDWREVSRERRPANGDGAPSFSFVELRRA